MRLTFLLFLYAGLAAASLAAPPLAVTPTDVIQTLEARRHGGGFSLDADSLHSYDQLTLSIDYRVEDAGVDAVGWVHIRLRAREALASIPFNAENMAIDTVTVDGDAVDFTHNGATVEVEQTLAPGDTVTVGFRVRVHNGQGYGYSYAGDHGYSFAEPYGARRWFPCWDQPYDKFDSVTLAVNMPEHWVLAANGRLVESTIPASHRRREVYVHDYPISSYLVMITAGEYARRYETVDNVLYRYITFHEDSAAAVIDWSRTPQMTAFFSQTFGEYPFGEYGMVEASFGGAMEHQTMTTYGRNLVTGSLAYEGVVAHELAHQWFGDDLSPVDFRNIWLNEGFATYATALFYQEVELPEVFQEIMQNDARYYFQEDNFRRYAAYNPPAEFLFGAVEYQKGSWVLHMLREQLLGDSLFFAALQRYVADHRAGTVNTEDFITAVNSVAGADLHWFFDQWIYQAGHPELTITIQPGVPTARDVTVSVTQSQTNAPIFRFPLLLTVNTVEGTVERQFWFNGQTQSVTESFTSDVTSAALHDFQPLLYELTSTDTPTPGAGVPTRFALDAVYPNPFNAAARIPFELPVASDVRLAVYDITGRLVATLINRQMEAGRHALLYAPGADVASGIYIVSLTAGKERRQVKAVLLR